MRRLRPPGPQRLARLVLLTPLLAAACIELAPKEREDDVPDTGAEDGASGEAEGAWSGSFADGALSGGWWVEETWETGACVELRLQSDAALSDWSARLLLDAPVETFVYGGGGAEVVQESAQVLSWRPLAGSTALDAGGGVASAYCAEPLVRPSAFLAEARLADDDDGGGGSDGGGSDGGDDGGLPWEDEPTEGELSSGDAVLTWSFSGTWGYEGCYALTLDNNADYSWTADWDARVRFSGPAEPVSVSGLSVGTVSDDTLSLFTGSPVAPGGTLAGTVCLEVGSPPLSMEISP